MTTTYNVGDGAFFLSKRGIVGIQYDFITQIIIDDKGTKYRIDNYLMNETELFGEPEKLLKALKQSIPQLNQEPFTN